MAQKDLVQIIRDNPGCVAIVDNDWWTLHKVHPYGPEAPSEDSTPEDEYEQWEQKNTLASADDVEPIGSGYGSGNCYGGDILQALAAIVGIRVESV